MAMSLVFEIIDFYFTTIPKKEKKSCLFDFWFQKLYKFKQNEHIRRTENREEKKNTGTQQTIEWNGMKRKMDDFQKQEYSVCVFVHTLFESQ